MVRSTKQQPAHKEKSGDTRGGASERQWKNPTPPKTASTRLDSVMYDVTTHKYEPEDFEEPLREIDGAINAVDILQETT